MCEALENYANDAKAEGRSEGLAAGKEIGRNEGLAAGKEIGRSEGLAAGKEIGRNEGIQFEQKRIFKKLINELHMSEEKARIFIGYSNN